MEGLVQKYSQGLEKLSTPVKEDIGPRNVALVGSTGYLGPHLLASILELPSIASVYWLNSGSTVEKTLKSTGYQEIECSRSIQFFVANLSSAKLGLSDGDFSEVSVKVDTIMHNSWHPSFSLSLSFFEKPFLLGLRKIVDWARRRPTPPRFVFISSIAGVGNWSKVVPSQPHIPESRIEDPDVAMHMGYGESKRAGQHMLQIAHDVCGIPISVVRIGQICGPSTQSGGKWPTQGWLLAIDTTSKALGALPTRVAPVNWIPADALATQITLVVTHASTSVEYHVFNVVYPDVASWELFLNVLRNRFSVDAGRISLPEWLNRLEERANLNLEEQKKYVALRFSDFLRSMGDWQRRYDK
ncbi:ochratoxin A non-ribosomal peptide synthetase [Paraphaeosphaeria sporulosa]